MRRLSSTGAKERLAFAAALILVAVVGLWLGVRESQAPAPRDFEECAAQAQAKAESGNERNTLMVSCGARFAGRRKPGGGYTYYDFLQDRHFDIAGPNPTAEERQEMDRAYMAFLDAQRREAVSAELAERRNEQLDSELENARQPAGPPLILTPPGPHSPVTKRTADRSKAAHCDNGSLFCSWEKLSAAVKNAFASLSKPKP